MAVNVGVGALLTLAPGPPSMMSGSHQAHSQVEPPADKP